MLKSQNFRVNVQLVVVSLVSIMGVVMINSNIDFRLAAQSILSPC